MTLGVEIEVQSLRSMAGYVFAGDNRCLERPFLPGVGATLAKKFAAVNFSVNGDLGLWSVREGQVVFGERSLRLHTLIGGANELAATVEGTTADARDVLREAWTHIVSLADEPMSELSSIPGADATSTVAVVRLPVLPEELFPPLTVLMARTRACLGTAMVEGPGQRPFSFTVPITVAIGGLNVQRDLRIEPRATARDTDRVYFTTSPLPSEDHLEMLRAVVASVRSRPTDGAA
ncbi:MAG: hypothetical protein IPF92_30785 [Myxococcales bacterium]|nr:hypothetical protein [Myxococcales bacterium]